MKKMFSLLMAVYVLVLNLAPAIALGKGAAVFSISCCGAEQQESDDCCSTYGHSKETPKNCRQGDCNPFMTHCAICAIVAICPIAGIDIIGLFQSYSNPQYSDFVAQWNDQFVYSCLHPPEIIS